MSATRPWARAAALPVPAGDRALPEVAALRGGLPSVEALFTFMRDAELRFDTLRMRIEERAWTARGEELTVIEVALRHPGAVKVLSSVPARGTAANSTSGSPMGRPSRPTPPGASSGRGGRSALW